MSEIILFTKQGCQKCEYVKSKIPAGLNIRILDADTADGLAEMAYYELTSKNVPILVADGKIFEGAINIKNKMTKLSQK